jgi:Protein of unknown function (DUF3037)
MTGSGLYTIVRFVEDLERREPKNVGVLVAGPAGLLARVVGRDDLGHHNEVVQRFEGLLQHIIHERTRAGVAPEDLLKELASRRFSHFEIERPRPITLDDEPDAFLTQLVERVVSPTADRFVTS